jgi:membrane fusion protein (multidrug efflux system)
MAENGKSRLVPILVGSAAAVAVAVGGTIWWIGKQHYERTDNAFIQADKVAIAPLIDGYVAEVLVNDNQPVQPGQVLVRIDPVSIKARLAQAEANAQALEAGVAQVDDKARLEQAMIAQKAAGVSSAQAQAKMAKEDFDRYAALAKQGWVSTQRAQSIRTAQDQATAAVDQAQATLEAERRAAQSLGSAKAQTQAQAAAARAAVDQARIDLARTEIRSPVAGVVGAKGVRVGQYVRPGGALMSVVPLGDAYIVAIKADAFGKQTIKGRIDSFAPATGSEFAMIPVENAVGNFTKIAQRLPVKIAVDRSQPLAGALRPGLSVQVRVDVTQNTGPGFAEAGFTPAQYARRGVVR